MTFNSFSFLLFLVLLLSYTPRSLSYRSIFGPKVEDNELVKICAKALKPAFCYDTLRADRKTGTASLRELTFIAVAVATENAFGTFITLGNWVNKTSDATLQKRYQLCYEVYYTINDLLVKARDDSDPSHPIVIEDLVTSVLRNAGKCHDQFLTPPSGETSLKNRGDKLVQDCDIITVVDAYGSIKT